MAESKPIRNEEIADIEGLNKKLEETLLNVQNINNAFKDTLKINKQIIEVNSNKNETKNIDETSKALHESNIVRKKQIELEELEQKLKQQILLTSQQETKTLKEQLSLKVAEQREIDKAQKAKDKEVKALRELNSAYSIAQKRLTELSLKQRDLAVKQELGTKLTRQEAKELKTLTTEITKLDKALKAADESQGKFQRNVGNYEKATKGLRAATNKGGAFLGGFLGGFAGDQISKGISDIFAGTSEKAQNFQLILERTFNLVANIGTAVKNFIVGYAIPQFTQLALKIEKAFTFDSDRLKEINKELDQTQKTLNEFSNPFDGIVDRITKTDEITKKLIKTRFALIQQESLLSQSIQNRVAQEQILTQISENDTLGFQTRAKAAKDLLNVQKQRLDLETQLAQKQLDQQAEIVRLGLEREGIADRFTKDQIKSLAFLEDQEAFNKTNIEDLEKLKQARLAYNNIQLQSELFDADRAEKNQKRLQDLLDNTLDNQKDIFDKTQAYNASLINNDRLTLAYRKKVLDENKRLGEKSFQDQNETLKAYFLDRLERENSLAKGVNKLTKDQLKAKQDAIAKEIDLNELIKISDGQVLDQKLQSLNFSEQESLRFKQSLEERKSALRDRLDEENTFDAKVREKNERIASSERTRIQNESDFKITELERTYDKQAFIEENKTLFTAKKLKEINSKIEAERQAQLLRDYDEEKKTIEASIVEQDEKAQKILEINEKLNQDLQNLAEETAQKQKDLDRQQFLSRLDYAEKVGQEILSSLSEELDKEYALRQKNLDSQLQQRQDNISAQQALFQTGQKNQLAFEQAQLAKQQLERQDLEKKAAKQRETIQLAEALLQAYIAELRQPNNNPTTAGLKAVANVTLFKALAKGIASFFVGTDDTGKANEPLDSNGGRLAVLHDNEQVWSKSDRAEVGFRTRDDIKDIVRMYDLNKGDTATNIYQSISLHETTKAIKDLHKEIASRPTQIFRLNEIKEIVQMEVTAQYTKKTTIKKDPFK